MVFVQKAAEGEKKLTNKKTPAYIRVELEVITTRTTKMDKTKVEEASDNLVKISRIVNTRKLRGRSSKVIPPWSS